MKPKILMMTPSLGTGGAERVACNLAGSLFEKGYGVTLAVLRLNKRSYAVAEGINVVSLCNGIPTLNPFSRFLFAIRTFVNFYSILRKEKPDIVISHTTNANAWTGLMCTIMRVRYIIMEHTTPDRTLYKLNTFFRNLYFYLYKRSEALVVPSRGIMLQLKKNSLFKQLKNVKVIYNPISKFNAVDPQPLHSKPFILSVGRLHQVKGFDRLICAFSRLQDRDVDLLIVGEGNERDDLNDLVRKLGLENRVFLPGAKSNVQDYYKQCEVYVLASRNEGYPVGLIEAMSLGCACVAFDCDFGPREIIEDKVNGLLVPNGDIERLTQGIDSLLRNEPLKSKIEENAKLVAHSNSVEYITSQWEHLINGNSHEGELVA